MTFWQWTHSIRCDPPIAEVGVSRSVWRRNRPPSMPRFGFGLFGMTPPLSPVSHSPLSTGLFSALLCAIDGPTRQHPEASQSKQLWKPLDGAFAPPYTGQ